MKKIPLSRGLFALVDEEDYERLKNYKWYAQKGKKTNYAVRSHKRKQVMMHTEIIGTIDGLQVDHIDGNGLNNQKSNMRHVTNRQNSQNVRTTKPTSRFPGAYWNKKDRLWYATVRINNIRTHIGIFKKEEEAFLAYRETLNNMGELLLPEWQNLEVIP